jgi:hypothetical protein
MSEQRSTMGGASLLSDPGLLFYQMDIVQRRALIVRSSEDEIRKASFLDERLGLQGRDGFWLPLDELNALAGSLSDDAASPDFIFHIGHCGSTLLSRLLDRSPHVLGLREPLPLRELAASLRDLDSPLSRIDRSTWEGLLRTCLALLGRRFAPQQRIVVKATSTCNGLVNPILERCPKSRAVLLYIRLEPYLATMAKAAAGGLDALHAAPARLQYLHDCLDDDSIRLHDLKPPEIVAMNWVAELARFDQLSRASPARERMLMLDFEQLLLNVYRGLGDVCRHLGIAEADSDSTQDPHASVLGAYAKSPAHAYSPTDRDHDLSLSRRKFSTEIELGLRWAERVMGEHDQLAALRQLIP